MQEFFFTILTIWVLFRLFGQSRVSYNYTAHHHHHNTPKEGEVRIENPGSKASPGGKAQPGEYVDYEEVR